MKLSPNTSIETTVVIHDPMVATGGTTDMTIDLLKQRGVQEETIVVACVIATSEGLTRLSQKHPAIRLVFKTFDERLNEHKYIVPGLGDFGDRYF